MRARFGVLLVFMILMVACGGGNGNSDGSGAGTTEDGSSVPTGTGDEASGSPTVADGSETPGPTATIQRMIVQPTRTPRPTSTPFPTATLVAAAPTSTTDAATGSTAAPESTSAPDATQDTAGPTATPGPDPEVEIISTNVFRNPEAGAAIIFGEVQNASDVAATGVQVSATLLDASGNRVGRGESEAVGKTVMHPGDIAGFSILVTFDEGGYVEWASQDIVASYNFTRPEIVASYTADLTISDDTQIGPETGFDFVDVRGNLTNDSGIPLRFVQVGATAYDAAGNVISVDSFVTSDILEPGATIPFSVEFSRGRLKEFPASYKLVVEGLDASQ